MEDSASLKMINEADLKMNWPTRFLAWFVSSFFFTLYGVFFSFSWFRRPYSLWILSAFILIDVVRQFRDYEPTFLSAEELFPSEERKPIILPIKSGKEAKLIMPAVWLMGLGSIIYLLLCFLFDRHGGGCIDNKEVFFIFRSYIALANGCDFYVPAYVFSLLQLLLCSIYIFVIPISVKKVFIYMEKYWFISNRNINFKTCCMLIGYFLFMYLFFPFCFGYIHYFSYNLPMLKNFRVGDFMLTAVHWGIVIVFFAGLGNLYSAILLTKAYLKRGNRRFYLIQNRLAQQWLRPGEIQ